MCNHYSIRLSMGNNIIISIDIYILSTTNILHKAVICIHKSCVSNRKYFSPSNMPLQRIHSLPGSIESRTAKASYDPVDHHILNETAKTESAAFSCPASSSAAMAYAALTPSSVSERFCKIKGIR